jgi:hypothetical protein
LLFRCQPPPGTTLYKFNIALISNTFDFFLDVNVIMLTYHV